MGTSVSPWHSGAVRACVSHTGPPDQLKGDAPHKAGDGG
jgi:hypothetical protein